MGVEGIEPSTFPASAGRSPNELHPHGCIPIEEFEYF